MAVELRDHRIVISVDRHRLDDTDGFAFSLQLWEVTSLGGSYHEFAPDTRAWSFPVKIAIRRLRPSLQTSPRHPRAGNRLVALLAVRVAGTRQLLGSGRVLCAASVGGRTLHRVSGAFAGRRARCAWYVPVGSEGKILRCSVAVAVTSSARPSRRFALPVG